jgi:ABC-type multidrug transport system fused ATPase/permease subunit
LGLSPGVIAGFIGAAVPLNFFNQTAGDFDQPYTMLGLAGLCCLLGSDWARERFPLRGGMILGVFSGVLCLLNPAVMQVLVGCYLFGMLRFATRRREFSIFMATVAAFIVLFLSPWAYRNYKALGVAIWTRSDFGLELSVSNNDDASAQYEVNVLSPNSPHPLTQKKENDRVRQMGEVAYNRAKQKEAVSWIRNHPARFAQLATQRYVLFWFPLMKRWWQTIAEALITVFAIAGLLGLFRKRHPVSWMLLAILVFYPAVYVFVAVGPRYRLPIEPILLFLSGCFCVHLWKTLENRRKENSSPVAGD